MPSIEIPEEPKRNPSKRQRVDGGELGNETPGTAAEKGTPGTAAEKDDEQFYNYKGTFVMNPFSPENLRALASMDKTLRQEVATTIAREAGWIHKQMLKRKTAIEEAKADVYEHLFRLLMLQGGGSRCCEFECCNLVEVGCGHDPMPEVCSLFQSILVGQLGSPNENYGNQIYPRRGRRGKSVLIDPYTASFLQEVMRSRGSSPRLVFAAYSTTIANVVGLGEGLQAPTSASDEERNTRRLPKCGDSTLGKYVEEMKKDRSQANFYLWRNMHIEQLPELAKNIQEMLPLSLSDSAEELNLQQSRLLLTLLGDNKVQLVPGGEGTRVPVLHTGAEAWQVLLGNHQTQALLKAGVEVKCLQMPAWAKQLFKRFFAEKKAVDKIGEPLLPLCLFSRGEVLVQVHCVTCNGKGASCGAGCDSLCKAVKEGIAEKLEKYRSGRVDPTKMSDTKVDQYDVYDAFARVFPDDRNLKESEFPLQTEESRTARAQYVQNIANFQYPAGASLDETILMFRRIQNQELSERIAQARAFLQDVEAAASKLSCDPEEEHALAQILRDMICRGLNPLDPEGGFFPPIVQQLWGRCNGKGVIEGAEFLEKLEFFGLLDEYKHTIFEGFVCELVPAEFDLQFKLAPTSDTTKTVAVSRDVFIQNTSAASLAAFAMKFEEAHKTARWCADAVRFQQGLRPEMLIEEACAFLNFVS